MDCGITQNNQAFGITDTFGIRPNGPRDAIACRFSMDRTDVLLTQFTLATTCANYTLRAAIDLLQAFYKTLFFPVRQRYLVIS